jgi:DNA-binding NarL/FixJ family response regulator
MDQRPPHFTQAMIVEDIAATRDWLSGLVHDAFRGIAVYHACDLRSARAWFVQPRLEAAGLLVLVDLGLPDGSGIDLIREVHQQYPEAVLIVTTVYDDDDNLMRAMAAGADSYLLKDRPSAELSELLRRIDQGEAALSPPMARRLLARFRGHASFMTAGTTATPSGAVSEQGLTPRESEVLAMIGRGLTLAEAAKALEISAQTVATHVKAVYRKLGINSRAEAAMEAVRRKLA